ncbi:hypothetical protein M404DRAFT_29412 [Pisolithus tinctorius Marx 270]|uniref:Uncharacterized protein n=1 Tax=Pisolithus tinctorius Marx 270 TaxID=870435 RepID=A0A0C3NYY3_PISTI|nr:hypothetical protein M404DRAFT_29412 [Pisolithus tinctorius Marx 270]
MKALLEYESHGQRGCCSDMKDPGPGPMVDHFLEKRYAISPGRTIPKLTPLCSSEDMMTHQRIHATRVSLVEAGTISRKVLMNLLVSETIHTHGPLSANDIVLLAAYASRMENHGEDTNQTIDDALALGVKVKVLKDGPSPGGKRMNSFSTPVVSLVSSPNIV